MSRGLAGRGAVSGATVQVGEDRVPQVVAVENDAMTRVQRLRLLPGC